MYQLDLDVVIPVYNEEAIIEQVVREWHSLLTELNLKFRITCLNDGSKDRSLSILERLAETLKELNVVDKSNSGHGPTVLKGYQESESAEWIFQVDSDNEISASEFVKVWNKRNEAECVMGVRKNRTSTPIRKLASFTAQAVNSLLFGGNIRDVNAPFRLMKSDKFKSIFQSIPRNTFAPNVIISGLVAYYKISLLQIDISFQNRQTGEVSIKQFKLLKALILSLIQTFLFRLSTTPRDPDKKVQRRNKLAILFIIPILAMMQVSRVDLLSGWWFEDDTINFSYVENHQSVIDYFIDGSKLSAPMMGTQPLPIQYASYWFDQHILPHGVQYSYLHSALLYSVTSILLFLLLSKFMSYFSAFMICLTWMLLPSTLTILEFLSTRHYMYGMFFSLLAAMMLLKAQEARKILQLPLLSVAFFATFAAVLSKQIFLTSTLPLIFLMCASKKYWRGLIVPVLVAVVYLPYVHFLTGLDYNYSPSTVATSQIAQYIHRALYMVTVSKTFYVLAGVLAISVVLKSIKSRIDKIELVTLLSWTTVFLLCLVTCFAVSLPIVATYTQYGTWQRSIFALSSVSIVGILCVISAMVPRLISRAVTVLTFTSIFIGSQHSASHWSVEKEKYARQGKFVLENPDKTLVSDLPAWWFFTGIKSMYKLDKKNWILKSRGEKVSEKSTNLWIAHGKQITDSNISTN